MTNGITILDAFKSLEDIDDIQVEPTLKKIKEHKAKPIKESVETIDISGRDMYDKGQAYYYARTGDHVDYNGKKYEIVMDKDGGHKIGYSDTILLKGEDGKTIEVAKKDFIKDATLLKEEVVTEALDDYWVLSDGKNPKNSTVYGELDDVDGFINSLEPGEKYWELLHYVKGNPTKVWSTKEGKISESCELKEEPYLEPEYDSRKSFYKKAYVDEKDDGTKVLYSYGTPVCRIKDGKATLLRKGYLGWASSQTTLRHVKEFLKQNGFEAGSINDLRKNYPIEQAGYNESLSEGMKVNLMDEEQVEEGEKFLASSDEDAVEQVVDVDANTIEELKDSYLGNVILRCPSCKTMIYKKPELLEKDGESDVYNVGETCPHCGAQDGFELVGQVASLDIKPQEDAPTTGQDTVEVEQKTVEDEIRDEVDGQVEEEDVEIKKPSIITKESLDSSNPINSLDDIDEESLNKLINRYLESTYNNVESYTTTSSKLDEGCLTISGTIKFKSGKEKETSFVLSECVVTKGGKYKLSGINETFSDSKAFTFIGNVVKGNLVCESLSYKYTTLKESKKVIGKVRLTEQKTKRI